MNKNYTNNEIVDEIVVSDLKPELKNAIIFQMCLNNALLEYIIQINRESAIEGIHKRAVQTAEELDRHYIERHKQWEAQQAEVKSPFTKKILSLVN